MIPSGGAPSAIRLRVPADADMAAVVRVAARVVASRAGLGALPAVAVGDAAAAAFSALVDEGGSAEIVEVVLGVAAKRVDVVLSRGDHEHRLTA